MITRIWMVLLMGACLALTGCSGGDGDAGGGEDGGGDGYADGGSATTSGGSSSSSGDGYDDSGSYEDEVEIDFDFPTHVAPPYPGAKVIASSTEATTSSLTVQTPDLPKKIREYYETRFANWEQPIHHQQAQLTTLNFVSPGGRVVAIMINRDPLKDVSIVNVTVAK